MFRIDKNKGQKIEDRGAATEPNNNVVVTVSTAVSGNGPMDSFIGDYAFGYCESLVSLAVPLGMTRIGESAFYYCSSLASVSLPSSVVIIANYAFRHCVSLTSVSIPDSVISIGNYAFSGCRSLRFVELPNSISTIGKYAFSRCSSLTAINLPTYIKSIGDAVFFGCPLLTMYIEGRDGDRDNEEDVDNNCRKGRDTDSKEVGDGREDREDAEDRECTEGTKSRKATEAIEAIHGIRGEKSTTCTESEEKTENIYNFAVKDSVLYMRDRKKLVCAIGSPHLVNIPTGVTEIADSSFRECESLTSVNIPSSVKSIGRHAFCCCSSLKVVTIAGAICRSIDIGFVFFRCPVGVINIIDYCERARLTGLSDKCEEPYIWFAKHMFRRKGEFKCDERGWGSSINRMQLCNSSRIILF